MRKILFVCLASMLLATSQAQIKTPAPSPTQTVKQDFGLSSIELSYSRPGIKKRTLYTDLAPAGKVWRTGANSATTITFGDEVSINGTKVPAGKYGILSIPDKKSWIIIITKQTDVTSPADYKQDQDVVRIPVAVTKTKSAVESFTIQFANLKNTSLDLQIAWDKSAVSFPITADIDQRVMSSIESAMKGDKPPYFQAAVYYMDNGKDLNQALAWFNKAVEAQPDAFYIQYQWAQCLAKLGKKTEAKAAAERSRELSLKAKNNDYVAMNDKLLKELAK
jgi:hypothetical protein